MNIHAYIDDSVDEDGTYVLAGYIATAEEWALFSQEWEKMLPTATLNERNEFHFKMSEMALSPERMSRVSAFQNIINRHVLMSLACVIRKQDLDAAKKKNIFCSSGVFSFRFSTSNF